MFPIVNPPNLPAILIANFMGITILFSVLVARYVGVRDKRRESKLLNSMAIIMFLSCICDPICFIFDGKPGLISFLLVYVCNAWLYVSNIIMICAWLMLVASHLGFKFNKSHIALIGFLCVACLIILIVNIFEPILFQVVDNVYSRNWAYWIFLGVQGIILIDGFVLYFYAKRKSDSLKFFPVLAFTLPSILGMLIQSGYYGVSTITPFMTVSLACIIICLQNELIFRDKLTGLYNRFYLNKLESKLNKHNKWEYTAMMLDINGFKNINDTFGHEVGDKALMEVASILRDVIRERGVVVRYAGDEFIIIVSTHSDAETDQIVNNIHRSLANFNNTSGNLYKLTMSIGKCKLNFNNNSLDKFLDRIDKLMYESKREYYKENPKLSRRETERCDLVISDEFKDCKTILDSLLETAIYVVEETTHKILFINRKFKELNPQAEVGAFCSEVLDGPCDDCPMKSIGEKAVTRRAVYLNKSGASKEITATRLMWRGVIPAIMLIVTPHFVIDQIDVENNNSENLLSTDNITGGLTRAGFINSVEKLRKTGNDITDYSVLYLNIKDFKAVNEMVGCDGGDNLLRNLLNRISKSSLKPILASRNASDHFIFLVKNSNLDYEVFNDLLNYHWAYKEKTLFVHCRCGIFNVNRNNLEVYQMIDRAKIAKEHIVDEFVKPYAIYNHSMIEEYSEKASAFLLFDNGMKNKEFVCYFQPIVDSKTGKVVSAEALVRRITADGKVISPASFVPILENTGYITRLDEFIVDEVSRFQYNRQSKGLPIIPISLNVSQKDFYDVALIERLTNRLRTSKLPKGSIMIELTESAYALNEKQHGAYLTAFRELGAKILLDDFGSGYSSFGMFENYNFDRIKLDMSFTRQITQNANVKKVVHSMIAMCHDLGVSVVAEGVETKEELEILRELECDYIQGYYYSKPMSETDFTKYLKNNM